MSTTWSELEAEGQRHPIQPEAWLDRLIDPEMADRKERRLRYQLKAACFPIHWDLIKLNRAETAQPRVQIEQLASTAFIETAHNLILVDCTLTGKTHLATALGVAPFIRASVSVSTIRLTWLTSWNEKSSKVN